MPDTHFHILAFYYGTLSQSGSRRWRELSSILTQHGEVTVYCADGGGDHCPQDVEVVHLPDRDFGEQKKIFCFRERPAYVLFLMHLASSLLCWPDRQKRWSAKAVGEISRRLAEGKRNVVVTSGPVFSPHSEMCRWVNKNPSRVTWVMDFRDMWTNEIAPGLQRRIPGFLTNVFERRIEQQCHDTADVVTTIGEVMAGLLAKDFGSSPVVMHNGYRKVENTNRPGEQPAAGQPLNVRYLGTIFPGLRTPALLFQAAAKLGLGPGRLKFQFWCNEHKLVLGEAAKYGVENLVECHQGVPGPKAWELACTADANLILNGLEENSNQVLTGKVFELMQSGRPAITVTGKDSELRTIATNCRQSPVVWDLDTAIRAMEALLDGKLPILEDTGRNYSWDKAVEKFLSSIGG